MSLNPISCGPNSNIDFWQCTSALVCSKDHPNNHYQKRGTLLPLTMMWTIIRVHKKEERRV
jgi:hypothetical protein